MGLTKITSRILDSSGVTILGTIATGVWQGTAINQTYLVGQSGTNTGDETLARINALDVTELGTISSGVWNGTAIASAYLDTDTAHLSTTQTFTGAKTFSNSVAVGGWIIPNGVNALTADSSHTYLQQPSGGDILLRKSDGTSFVTITNGGNVGVGTATPFGVTSNRTSLSVNGTTSSVVNVGTGNAQRGFFYAESDKVLLNTSLAIPLILGTNNNDHLTIASGGATTLFTNIGSGLDNAQLTIKSDGSAVTTGLMFVNAANTSSFNDLAGIASYIESGNAKGNLKFWTRNSDGNNNDRTTRLTISNTGAATFSSSVTSGGFGAFTGVSNGSPVLTLGTAGTINAVINTADEMFFNIDSDNNQTSARFIFGTNRTGTTGGSTLVTFQENGIVKIGTTNNFNEKLIVSSANGTAYTSVPQMRVDSKTNNHRAAIVFTDSSTSDGKISYYPHTTPASRYFSISTKDSESDFVIRGNGNVGIGTTSPSSKLHLKDDGTNSDVGIKIGNDSRDWNLKVMGSVSDSLQFFTHDNSNVMTILPSGNVGIGIAPSSKFQVNDGTNINLAIKVGQTNTSAVMLNAYNDASTANIPMEFRASSFAFQNGNVGIGTIAPVQPLQLGDVSVITQDVNSMYVGVNFGGSTNGTYIKSQYANQIHFDSATGQIKFRMAASGSQGNNISYTTAMRISSDGYVTKTSQPAFKAGRNGSISTAAGASILFNHVSGNHFNDGGHYSTGNGRFTAPVAGTYIFSVVVIYEGLSTNQVMTDSFYIHKNTTNVAYSFRRANYVGSNTGTSGYYVDHANTMIQLAANDYVHIVNARALAVHGNSNYTYFYGYLLG